MTVFAHPPPIKECSAHEILLAPPTIAEEPLNTTFPSPPPIKEAASHTPFVFPPTITDKNDEPDKAGVPIQLN